MVYKSTIPQPGDSPATASQADLLENFAQIDSQYGTAGDHVEFTAAANNGKHNQATLLDVGGAVPVSIAGEGIIYTDTVGARIEPFYGYPAGGPTTQLTWIKAWAQFVGNGGLGAAVINDSYNVSGVNKDSASLFTVSFTTNLGNINYGVIGTAGNPTGAPSVRLRSGTQAIGSVQIGTSLDNLPIITVMVIGT